MIHASQSFVNYEEQLQSNSCRICLQPYQGEAQSFCNCKGNSQFVHEVCLLQWAKRAIKFTTKEFQVYFLCDLCQAKIYLQVQTTCKCRKKQDIILLRGISKIQLGLLLSTVIIFALIAVLCLRALLAGNQLSVLLLILSIIFGLISLSSLSLLFCKIFYTAEKQVAGLKRIEPRPSHFRIANTHTLQNL